jgi:hypothetical protein
MEPSSREKEEITWLQIHFNDLRAEILSSLREEKGKRRRRRREREREREKEREGEREREREREGEGERERGRERERERGRGDLKVVDGTEVEIFNGVGIKLNSFVIRQLVEDGVGHWLAI